MHYHELRTGEALWLHRQGRIYHGVIQAATVGTGFYLYLGGTQRKLISSTKNLYSTKDQAANAAEAWLLPRVRRAQRRADRLSGLVAKLKMNAGVWTDDVPKADWARYSCGKPVVTIKMKKVDRWDWKTKFAKGSQVTLQEAKDAADAALRDAFWTLL